MSWFSKSREEEKEQGYVVFFPNSNKFLYDLVTGDQTRQVKRAWFFSAQKDAQYYANYYGGVIYSATKTIIHTELGELLA